MRLALNHIDINDAWMEFDTAYTLVGKFTPAYTDTNSVCLIHPPTEFPKFYLFVPTPRYLCYPSPSTLHTIVR